MPKYQIVKNRVILFDDRFDPYLNEALSFFRKLEELIGSPPPLDLNVTKELIELQNNRWADISEAIENCRHKIQAVNYSISLIKSEVELPPIIGQKVVPINLDETEFLDDVILFEFESFLAQVVSTLDIFIHLVALFYPSVNSEKKYLVGFKGKSGNAGEKTINAIRSENNSFANYIKENVDDWIQKISDLRNLTIHQSRARSIQMFLIDKNGIHLPKLSDEEGLLEFCEDTYKKLKHFLFETEEKYLLPLTESYYTKQV